MNKDKIIQAGKIAKQVKDFARGIIKKDMSLLEIAEKIEGKIVELGAKPAFPTNLSINEIAAHYTPSHDSEDLAYGLLKVDIGVHADGWMADTAFSMDLEDSDENAKLIQASENALSKAQELIDVDVSTDDLGKAISSEIEALGFSPIINLSGHEIEQHDLHAGVTIPNFNSNKNVVLKKGLYAIEPFATTGGGKVRDGRLSGVYVLQEDKMPRSPIAREVLEFIMEEYKTLHFCSRWIVKKFGTKGSLGLKQLEDNGNLHHFAQLVEASGSKVSQAENTVLIGKEKVITTE